MRWLALLLVGASLTACSPGETTVTVLKLRGRPSAVAVSSKRAWVADDENHSVRVIDTESMRQTAQIGVAKNPIAIEAADNGTIWVGHAGGEVTVITADALRVEDVDDVGGSITGLSARGNTLWATDIERSELVAIDIKETEIRRRIKIEDGAIRVLASPDGVWVTNSENSVTLVRDFKIERTYEVGGGPIGLAWRDSAWTTNSDDDTVSRVASDGEVIEVGGGPVAAEFTDDGTMWVANQDEASLSVVTDGEQDRTVDIDVSPREMATDGEVVWVVGTNPEGVARVVP